MKFFISLLSLGTTLVGTFAGTLQQNLSHPQAPEIDRLFHEIEKDIRDFSLKNPLTKTESDNIKNPSSGSGSKRRKRNVTDSGAKESENTLEVWVYIWIQLVSNYIDKLWKNKSTKEREHPIIFTSQEKQTALKNSEETFIREKQEFKRVLLENLKEIFEKIYKKMKAFTLLTNLPKNYSTGSSDYPYEHHIKKILGK